MRSDSVFLVRALVLVTLLASGIAQAQAGKPQSAADLAAAEPAVAAPAEALSNAFTYQGRLDQNGSPVNDTCDMSFRLYDAASMGTEVGSDFHAGVPIVDGLFSVALDFGGRAFDGERRWLGIEVDCEEDGTYDNLGRQELSAAPYALYATGAPWSGLSGVPAGFADGIDDDTTYTAGEGLKLSRTEFSAESNPYANVVVVAKSGGDYSSVQAAIDSITDAAADNAYLVWVAPGVYSETVNMKPYVHLQGAGQEATVISSTITSNSSPPNQATLVLAENTSLRDLTVGNSGMGFCNTALLATAGTTRTLVTNVTARAQGVGTHSYAVCLTGSGTGVTLQRVTALGENGSSSNYGLFNYNGTAVTLRGGSFTGRGGIYARGVYNSSGTILQAEGIIALAENGSDTNYGLYNRYAEAVLRGGSFTARGGAEARSIWNRDDDARLKAIGVTALAENGGDYNYGLYNSEGAAATLRGGSFTGRGGTEAYGIYNISSDTTLEVEGVTALGENSSSNNFGLHNYGAVATLRGGSFVARGGTYTYGIHNFSANATLEASGVTVLAENGGDYNYGLYNSEGAAATLRGGSFTGRGGNRAYGIWNIGNFANDTTMEATDITALAENGTDYNYGLYNDYGTDAVLHSGSFIARGGNDAYGIYNDGINAKLKATGVTALGENGSGSNYGLYNHNTAIAEINSSRLTGSSYGLYLGIGTVYLSVTQLDGGADKFSTSALTCFQVYDENYAPYTCPP